MGLLALIWGSGFLWIKLGIGGLSPVEVTLSRLVLGSAVLFAIVAARRGSLPRSPVVWVHITVAALFANAAPYLLFAVGEQHVASATAGMLNATTPLWTVLIALGSRLPGSGGLLRHQLRVHGQVPGPPEHQPGRLVRLPARGSIGLAGARPGGERRPGPAA
jgi:drug/metabolite transporter (DMT)-like permease